MARENRGRGRAPLSTDVSWEEAVERVLADQGEAMHYTSIAEAISTSRLKSVANPAASVAATLAKSLQLEGSPFVRTGRGEYALKKNLEAPSENFPIESSDAAIAEAETGALRAFGMYWQRELVLWNTTTKLFGRQSDGASKVDFSLQVGVYLLHDRDRTIYVGRAADTLFARLKAHTSDRLSGRWDRFSWFGLKGVAEDGSLGGEGSDWTHTVVIETLEALLIETLEPPLNRKRGDNFSAAEFLQVADPELDKRRKMAMLQELSALNNLDKSG